MTDRNFLGIPVTGDINEGAQRANQKPLEELAPCIQAILDDGHVVEFGWNQYTPYFNDGEPCVFGVGETWVRTDVDDPDEETYEFDIYSHPTLSGRKWNGNNYVPAPLTPWQQDLWGKFKALADALESGCFDDVLLAAFGDHAEVTVRRGGIEVETYDHD